MAYTARNQTNTPLVKRIRHAKAGAAITRLPSRVLSAANKQWVEATLRKMTDDEKIGQLLFTTYHGSFTVHGCRRVSQDDARRGRSARRRVHQHHADVAARHRQEPGVSDGGAHQSVAGTLKIAAAHRRRFRTRHGHAPRRRHFFPDRDGAGRRRQSRRRVHHGKNHRAGSARRRHSVDLRAGFRREQ